MKSLRAINEQVSETLGRNDSLVSLGTVAGGDIHRSLRARLGSTELFIKFNRPSAANMFAAETECLAALRVEPGLRVPRPICHGADRDHAWLVMEYIDLAGHGDSRALGRGLAALHRRRGPRFGWEHDNFIGATPQLNSWANDWLKFWWRNRIEYQVRLAVANGHPPRLSDRAGLLKERLPDLFRGHTPVPSLLHGDLWGGNRGFTQRGEPVIFDPACYYGDRETDLAMTELFGGFDNGFYAAYQESHPLHHGYRRRKYLYQLYHLLNHLNLFGKGWLPRAESVLDRLIETSG